MSVTYTDPVVETTMNDDAFVPSYARGTRRKKPVRTWMILAPIGALALIGGGAVMMFGGAPTTAPLAEAEPPVIQPLTAAPAPLESSGVETATLPANASASIAAPAPAPVAETAPSAPPTVQRRQAAPVERRAAPAVNPRVETAPEPLTGPQAYTAQTPTAAAPTATPPAPSITVAPLN